MQGPRIFKERVREKLRTSHISAAVLKVLSKHLLVCQLLFSFPAVLLSWLLNLILLVVFKKTPRTNFLKATVQNASRKINGEVGETEGVVNSGLFFVYLICIWSGKCV